MIKVLGIPFDANSSFLKGTFMAPDRIRLMEKEGSANCFSEYGTEIIENKSHNDLGNLIFTGNDSKNAFNIIKEYIATHIGNNDKMLCLGGDHSITWPIIEAFSEKFDSLNILHFDAHTDLYENFENNLYSHASTFARILEVGKIRSLTQVGIRTLNTHQRNQIKRYGVSVVEMKNFTFDFIKTLKDPLYISLDLDVLDPAFAPGVSHHEPGGISTRELIQIIQSVKNNIVGADIVEYNPVRDVHSTTAMVAYKIFKELIAKMSEYPVDELQNNQVAS